MKAKDFKDFITAFAQMLSEARAYDQADAWAAFARIFDVKPGANVSDICKVLPSVEHTENGSGPSLAHLVRLIPTIEYCFSKHSKKALFDDLRRVANALAPFSEVSVESYVGAAVARLQEPPRSKTAKHTAVPAAELVEAYLRELQSALGDEIRFPEVFAALKKDKGIKVTEAKQLALAFADLNAKSKRDALELIWLRHASVVGARARARATAGRTAA